MELISRIAVGTFGGLPARRIVPNPDPGRFVAVLPGTAGAAVLLPCVDGHVARRTA